MTIRLTLGATVDAANDLLVLAAARQCDLRVPEDIAVVGVGDVNVAATYDPPLTIVAQRSLQLSMEAARLLLRRLGGDHSPAQQLRLPSTREVRRLDRRTSRDPPTYERFVAAL